jgi:hypothetical protein
MNQRKPYGAAPQNDDNRSPSWRTLQRAAVNFSSPFSGRLTLPAEDRQPHDKSCATAYTVYPFFNERFSPRQRRRRLRNER